MIFIYETSSLPIYRMTSFFQTDVTGVAEAFMNFTENFRKRSDVEIPEYDHRFVKSSKLLEVFVQVEKGEFIIGLSLSRFDLNLIFIR